MQSLSQENFENIVLFSLRFADNDEILLNYERYIICSSSIYVFLILSVNK